MLWPFIERNQGSIRYIVGNIESVPCRKLAGEKTGKATPKIIYQIHWHVFYAQNTA